MTKKIHFRDHSAFTPELTKKVSPLQLEDAINIVVAREDASNPSGVKLRSVKACPAISAIEKVQAPYI